MWVVDTATAQTVVTDSSPQHRTTATVARTATTTASVAGCGVRRATRHSLARMLSRVYSARMGAAKRSRSRSVPYANSRSNEPAARTVRWRVAASQRRSVQSKLVARTFAQSATNGSREKSITKSAAQGSVPSRSAGFPRRLVHAMHRQGAKSESRRCAYVCSMDSRYLMRRIIR